MPSLFIFLLLALASPFAAHAAAETAPPEAKPEATAAKPEAAEEAGPKKSEQTIAPVDAAWEVLWSGQKEMINEIRETALQLSDRFAEQTETLSHKLQPFDQEGRRLLVFANNFKGHPKSMEAINWRITTTLADLDEELEPVNRARAEAENMLARVNHMASNLPDDVDRSKFSPEMQAYIQGIQRARLRLTAVMAQYNSLLPSLELVKRLTRERDAIAASLPELWKNYYLQKPVAWLNPDVWANIPRLSFYSWQILLMRLPVEIPTTAAQWSAALLRFFIGVIFGGALTVLLRKRWLDPNSPQPFRHIFYAGAPWLVLGSAFLGASLSATGDFYRLFLSVGCCCVIFGELFIAWDLRRLQYAEAQAAFSPLFRLLPLAVVAYLIFYLPMPQPINLVIWVLALVICMLRHRRWKKFNQPKLQLETGFLECYPLLLWPCLFLALSGLHIFSMLLYLCYISLAIALQFSLGGMSIVNRINEHLPQEGARAVLARLGVALAAPCVLILAVAGLCLWVLILPGGTYLIGEYALKGVSIGATQFNIIQILLIISAFYLTRTVVSMGTRFLAKLPRQGGYFDATLVTPMQTALTYITWAIFGLFALNSLGMQLSNLAMVAGGLSVGIGFGMQTIVNNFLSGLILIFGRTLQVGDVVEVGGTTGRVRKISVRATMVETYDNAIIYVPNSEFMAGRLTNWTSFTRSVRCQIQVGVAYGSDTDKVISLLVEIAKNHENVLKYPAPSVNFADFAASSLDFRLRFWVKDYELGASTSSQLRLAIDRVFAENSIEIAFPQLDVHLKDMPGVQPPQADQGAPRPPARKRVAPVARPPRVKKV